MILLNDDVNYLMDSYNVDGEFLKLLNAIMDDANAKGLTKGLVNDDFVSIPTPGESSVITKELSGDTTVNLMATVKDWKVYFSLDEVEMYFFAAAATGPVATTISLVLTIIGTATLVNLCYLITQAVVQKKGIYIGISWNGAFPNYAQGTW
ncbi:hypothetical protein MKY37_07270 [Psychrobacillus sp. FSL K6-2836]|uniref:hypothetical protein n=1 Tax=Psychrobacillus sp. FSL K6-2836 TaxID=2921548 RepID=UPI0030FAC9D5